MEIGDLQLLIGLIAIAISIGLSVFFGLRGFRRDIINELRTIRDTAIAIRGTVEKTWDLVVTRFAPSSGTIERELVNLGKVRITAEPATDETVYLIETEKPILKGDFIAKIARRGELLEKRKQLFNKEITAITSSPNRLRIHIPSTAPKACTEFVTFFLKWLDSTYIQALQELKEFEEPILT